ncbi:MAG: tetratricopeptide repeat protein [Candidatus Eisenbacteria bacterium]
MIQVAMVRPPAFTLLRRARLLGGVLLVSLACLVPPAHADALKDGKTALAEGRIDDAVAAYRGAVAATPNDPQAHLGLGLALEKKRNWKAALAEFQKSGELDPRLAEPFRGVGAMQLRLGNPAAAEPAFRKAVEIDRKFPEAQLGLGDALSQLKHFDDAVEVLRQGVKFGPKTEMFFFAGLGRANEARPESLKAAEVWLLKARQSAEGQNAPNSVKGPIYRALGDLYMMRKIPSLAIQNYQQAKAIDESDLDTRMALGDAYYNGRLYNDALAEYKAVVDADPEYEEGYVKLGNLYYLASFSDPQRVFQSIEVLEKLMAMDSNNLEGKAILAQAYFRKGGAEGKEKAKELLDEIEKTGKFPPAAWRTRAIIQYETGEYQNAIDSFGKAPRLEAIDQFRLGDAFRRLASEAPDSLRQTAYYDSADAVYRRIVEADSTTADAKKAQMERARLLYARKDFAHAQAEFQHLIALDPKACEAYYFLGLSQRAMGDDTGGTASLERAVECDPSRAPWWLQLGAAYSKQKLTDQARRAFEKTAELDSSTTGAVGLQQIGYFDLLAKQYSSAIQSLVESARRDPSQVMTWIWLGQARQNSGDRGGAIDAYHKALGLKPGQPDAMKGLKSLGAQ